ncbi:hypothetical protein ABK040_009273 [Willaertia magna]
MSLTILSPVCNSTFATTTTYISLAFTSINFCKEQEQIDNDYIKENVDNKEEAFEDYCKEDHTLLDIPLELWSEKILPFFNFTQKEIPTISLISSHFHKYIVPFSLKELKFCGKRFESGAENDIKMASEANDLAINIGTERGRGRGRGRGSNRGSRYYSRATDHTYKEFTTAMANRLKRFPYVTKLSFDKVYLKKEGRGTMKLLSVLNDTSNRRFKIREIKFKNTKGDFKSILTSDSCQKLEALTFKDCPGKIIAKDFPIMPSIKYFKYSDNIKCHTSIGKTTYLNHMMTIFPKLEELEFLDGNSRTSGLLTPSLYNLVKLEGLSKLNCNTKALSKKKLKFLIDGMPSLKSISFPDHFREDEEHEIKRYIVNAAIKKRVKRVL